MDVHTLDRERIDGDVASVPVLFVRFDALLSVPSPRSRTAIVPGRLRKGNLRNRDAFRRIGTSGSNNDGKREDEDPKNLSFVFPNTRSVDVTFVHHRCMKTKRFVYVPNRRIRRTPRRERIEKIRKRGENLD